MASDYVSSGAPNPGLGSRGQRKDPLSSRVGPGKLADRSSCAHDDDAARAVSAGLSIVEAMPALEASVGVPRGGLWQERLNSDAREYEGSGVGNMGGIEASPLACHGRHFSLSVTLPPLAILFFVQDGF